MAENLPCHPHSSNRCNCSDITAGRDLLTATLAAGVEYRIASGASIFLNAASDLGKTGQRESASLGVRWRM